MRNNTAIKNAAAFVAAIAVSVAVLYIDTGLNLLLRMQNSSWEIALRALMDSLSCLLLIAFCDWVEKRLKTDRPYITAAGMLAVFVLYTLRFTVNLSIDGPIYASFPTIILTAAIVRMVLRGSRVY